VPHLLGIDLGTSSVKAALVNASNGSVEGVSSRAYPIDMPLPGHIEQSPELWWQAVCEAVRAVMDQTGRPVIHAIGLAGQMHGAVLLDQAGTPLHPAIIWADQRSGAQAERMTVLIGAETLERITGTLPATGFMGATLLWIAENQPELLARTRTVLLPKDYVRFRMVGEFATETSDASAASLFDVTTQIWSREVIDALNLPVDIFPVVLNASDVAGTLIHEAADVLGLSAGIPVVAGCADQVAQAITNGLTTPDMASVTIGTGGQFFQAINMPRTFTNLHTFCHAFPNTWYVLGAMLSAGLSLNWLRDVLDIDDVSELERKAAEVPAGAEGLIFLPYLIGERAPIRDANASGAFIGLTMRHHEGHLARAVMEGVAFGLRQIAETVSAYQPLPDTLIAVGNGLRSRVWREITAAALRRPLRLTSEIEHTAVGAAYLAGLGTGLYASPSDLPSLKAVREGEITEPNAAMMETYEQQYAVYKSLYPFLAGTMHRLKGIG